MWLSFLTVWLLVRVAFRQPALFFQAFKRRLLGVVELESLESEVLDGGEVARPIEIALNALQGKKVAGFHGQNGVTGPLAVERATSLTFYQLNEQIPSVLAIARFTVCDNSTGEVLQVAEDVYYDSPDELCRVEYEVVEAITHGVDVDMSSWYELPTFPDINTFMDSD